MVPIIRQSRIWPIIPLQLCSSCQNTEEPDIFFWSETLFGLNPVDYDQFELTLDYFELAVKIAILYVLSGFGGSLLSSINLHSAISVGASGALFGLLGAMLSELITNWTIYANKVPLFLSIIEGGHYSKHLGSIWLQVLQETFHNPKLLKDLNFVKSNWLIIWWDHFSTGKTQTTFRTHRMFAARFSICVLKKEANSC